MRADCSTQSPSTDYDRTAKNVKPGPSANNLPAGTMELSPTDGDALHTQGTASGAQGPRQNSTSVVSCLNQSYKQGHQDIEHMDTHTPATVSVPGLKDRGWTTALIRDFLGEPDWLVKNRTTQPQPQCGCTHLSVSRRRRTTHIGKGDTPVAKAASEPFPLMNDQQPSGRSSLSMCATSEWSLPTRAKQSRLLKRR